MDLWEEPFEEPSEDELTARRVLSLAIVLTNANRALTTSEIRRELYGDLSTQAFRKAFQRDRERLLVAGFVLRNGKKVDSEMTWELDEESTFASETSLTQEDALTLDFLLLPYAADPSFPYGQDLRVALAKIDRSFDGSSRTSLPPEARRRNNNLTRVEHALVARHPIRIRYRRADGSSLERVVAPYGLFHLRGESFMVAARMGDNHPDDEPPHTYNVGRIGAVRELTRRTYDIPTDFDVRDYKKLPFQIGDVLYRASFSVSKDTARELRVTCGHQGQWSSRGEAYILTVSVSDEDIAASWAIAEGVRPIDPPALVHAWHTRLEKVAHGNS